jgi:ribosomal protein L16 Arg81 hydroxylase
VKLESIEDRATEALQYLTSTDAQAADLKHDADRAEANLDAVIAAVTLHSSAGSADKRKAEALLTEDVQNAQLAMFEARRQYDAVMNRRKSEAIAVEWLRSIYSHYRQGR